MRVAIAGGHGKIALLLTAMLRERGDEVVSLIRNSGHAADVEAAGGEAVVLDLEDAGADEIARAIGSADAIVFAAGAGPGSGTERKETVDYEAATKTIAAGRELGVRRFAMVSAMAADPGHPGDEVFDVYLRAKGRADAALAESGLEHVIVRPGMLTDDAGTGLVAAGESVERGAIPRADVAATLAVCLHEPAAANRTLELVGGQTPIEAAIAAL